MKRVYAVSTRLDMTDELKGYLGDYIRFYNSIERRVFYDICHGILRRPASAICFNIQGRINAYLALKKTEFSQIEAKIQSVRKRISKIEFGVRKLKDRARENSLDKKRLTDLRNGKASLYYQKNRLNRLAQRKSVLKQQIKERKVSLCFGTKKIV